MADSTIDALPSRSAWADGARSVASTAVRRIRPVWIVAAAIVGATALGVGAAQIDAEQLEGARIVQVERTASLENALRAQQLLDARTAVQIEDLRLRAAGQLAVLDSTEGFLK